MAFISPMAQGERRRIKFRLTDVLRADARQRRAKGDSAGHLAKVYSVSRATIYRV